MKGTDSLPVACVRNALIKRQAQPRVATSLLGLANVTISGPWTALPVRR